MIEKSHLQISDTEISTSDFNGVYSEISVYWIADLGPNHILPSIRAAVAPKWLQLPVWWEVARDLLGVRELLLLYCM